MIDLPTQDIVHLWTVFNQIIKNIMFFLDSVNY